MGTTTYFENTIIDQGGKSEVEIEVGRSSAYSNVQTENGQGVQSIYIKVDGKFVVMDLAMARAFVNGVADVGRYFGILDE